MLVIKKFANVDEANHMLKGGIVGGNAGGEFTGLVGNTITFTSPADSVTFTQPAGRTEGVMLFTDIKTQVEAQIPTIRAVIVNGKIGFVLATPNAAVTLASANEPARAMLGFPNQEAISGQFVNNPGGSNPALVSVFVENGVPFITLSV